MSSHKQNPKQPSDKPGQPALDVERVPIGSVHEDPANVRRHPERNIEAIKASLNRFGQQRPIIVDAKGTIVAGNGTYAAAKALGWSQIAIVRTNLVGAEAIAFAIADNRTAELAEWDVAELEQVLRALPADLADILDFKPEDLAALERAAAGEGFLPDVDPDQVPEPPDEAITKPGDLPTGAQGDETVFFPGDYLGQRASRPDPQGFHGQS